MTPQPEPRVLLLCMASGGEAYDRMRSATTCHADTAPDNVDVVFAYGRAVSPGAPGPPEATPGAVGYDVEECLIPGLMRKTLCALRDSRGYDYVVRSNLSTWFHWERLLAWLRAAPRRGLAAGLADDRSHLCGCCMVLSADVVERVLARRSELWDSDELDDVALSRVLFEDFKPAWIPRMDVYVTQPPGARLALHVADMDPADALEATFAVRCKSADRAADAAVMERLGGWYARGHRRLAGMVLWAAGIEEPPADGSPAGSR
jgi:hypothetical protein